jgi:hydroxymethylbilane synthase
VLNDVEAATAIAAERAFLACLGASCRTPVAGYARVQGEALHMRGLVGKADGTAILADQASGSVAAAAEVGVALAGALLARGAAAILASP